MNTLQIYKLATDIAGKVNKVAADLSADKIEKGAAKELINTHLTEALKKLDE